MAPWTSDELRRIDAADELQIAPLRRDGTLRTPVHRVAAGTAARGGGARHTQVRAAEHTGAELRHRGPDRAWGRRDRSAGRAGQWTG